MAELNASPQQNGGSVRRKKLSTRVDLTAMVDLAFLLITFFMLTTSLSKPHIQQVAMPDKGDTSNHTSYPESRTLTVCLGKNNQVVSYVGMVDKPLSNPQVTGFGKDGLRRAIVENSGRILKATGKDMLVLIKPSNHSVYSNLVDALDEMNITQVDKYSIADITTKDIDILKSKSAY
jgi:biopolymer transport protein ExbD